MIYRVEVRGADWLTLVVRAADEKEAEQIGGNCGREYLDKDFMGVSVVALHSEGPPGVLVEDAS